MSSQTVDRTTSTLGRELAPEAASKRAFRPDVQGLRALAVIAVIFDHLMNWPTGGFVGVDVFFVISGFLITGLLLREHDRTGRISFLGFYKRRAKRILPAALLVLLVTVAATWLLLSSGEFAAVAQDAGWAAVFVANWHFAANGTDYLHANNAISPLQHFWSLSVEEQFYFVWPWLMLLIFVTVGRRVSTRRGHQVAGGTISLLTLASFAWAIDQSVSNPQVAYFSTLTRAWELGLGALLAIGAGMFAGMAPAARTAAAWFGLTAIMVSVFLIDGSFAWPGPWTALPVLGATLVIAAGTGGRTRHFGVLTNPVATWLGDISYSLYLWHFPVVILLPALVPGGTPVFYVLGAGVILVLSVASYYGIENPIRSLGATNPARRRSAKSRRNPSFRLSHVAVAALLVVDIALICAVLVKNNDNKTEARAEAAGFSRSATFASAPPSTTSRTPIQEALAARSFPKLVPDVAAMASPPYVPEWIKDECIDIVPARVSHCVYGNAHGSHLVVVLGDSHAVSYLPMIRKALDSTWRIQVLTLGQCPTAEVTVVEQSPQHANGAPYPACNDHRAFAEQWVSQHQPDLVIATDAWSSIARIQDASGTSAQLAAYAIGMTKSVQALAPSTKHLVELLSPPGSGNLVQCQTRLATPTNCTTQVGPGYNQFVAALVSGVSAAKASNAQVVSSADWYCFDAQCPSFVGTTALYADGSHLTRPGSEFAAPLFKQALIRLKDI